MSILFWKVAFVFVFNLHIPICVKKARSQELTLHWVWKQAGRVSNEVKLAATSRSRFGNVTFGNL